MNYKINKKDFKEQAFIQIPQRESGIFSLPNSAFKLYVWLCSHNNGYEFNQYFMHSGLAGKDYRIIRKNLKVLEDIGAITIEDSIININYTFNSSNLTSSTFTTSSNFTTDSSNFTTTSSNFTTTSSNITTDYSSKITAKEEYIKEDKKEENKEKKQISNFENFLPEVSPLTRINEVEIKDFLSKYISSEINKNSLITAYKDYLQECKVENNKPYNYQSYLKILIGYSLQQLRKNIFNPFKIEVNYTNFNKEINKNEFNFDYHTPKEIQEVVNIPNDYLKKLVNSLELIEYKK